MLRNNLDYTIINSHSDKAGRVILLNVEINKCVYTFVNVYAPNNSANRKVFFREVNEFIDRYSENKNRIILGGDFNCTFSELDRSSRNIDQSSISLKNLIADLNVFDVWRIFHPNDREFTYINPSGKQNNSRIDFLLCSNVLKSCCISSKIHQSPSPDHKAVSISIRSKFNERGKGYWKLNNSIIDESEYVNGIKTIYNEVLAEYRDSISIHLLWDYLKLRIKQFSISYCIQRTTSYKNECSELEQELDVLDKKITSDETCNDATVQQRKIVKGRLDELYKKKSRGYHIRSRAKWLEEGDQCSKYFFGLEKSRQHSNCIMSLQDENGDTVFTDDEILQVANKFYSDLYDRKDVNESDINDYFDNIIPENVLSQENLQICEGLFTTEECFNAITKMKRNKSPGLDGISIEFYEKFWPLLGELLVDVFNDSFKKGILTDSQRLSVFALIFKKGNTEDISNYRPISLTNVDYRIMAFVLSNRLQCVIGDIVSHDQNAYIKQRYMGYNIRLVEDIIDYFDETKDKGILFMVDFKKAFDTLNWDFMFKTLDFFNFGPEFKRWIHTLYTHPVACIKNNGYTSNVFSIHRGVRQGCPVSALLFILCVEVLGLHIRQNNDLKGFSFGYSDKPVKIAQYADDCILFLNSKAELGNAINVLSDFGKVSGLLLNVSKCEGLWLGGYKNRQNHCTLYGIKWPEQIRCLGIYVGHDRKKNIEKNWTSKIDKVNHILKRWECHNLSLFGKVHVIKTFAISQFILPATILVVPPNILKTIESKLYKYLWGGRDKIQRLKSNMCVNQGGLNMIDVNMLFMSLKASWITKLLSANPCLHNWAQLPYKYFKPFLECNTNLMFNYDSSVEFDDLNCLNSFYKDAFLCYSNATAVDFENFKAHIASQCIWGNKFITVKRGKKKCVLLLRNWIRSGISKISDVRFANGVLDGSYVYKKVKKHTNIWSEIFLLQTALLPYREILRDIDNPTINNIPNVKFRTTKNFYNMFKDKLRDNTKCVTKYLMKYVNDDSDDNIIKIYREKIQMIKEIKLREFNFKILHGILACNLNLWQWKIKPSNLCDLCDKIQSIEHLLFDCIYVKPLWERVEQIYNVTIDYNVILGIRSNHDINCIVTMMSYFIYKEWLLLSLENRSRRNCTNLNFYKCELALRLEIYKQCENFDIEELNKIECMVSAL